MIKSIVLIFFVMSVLQAQDFEIEMGKGTDAWEHVQTAEDLQRVDFFKKLYEKNPLAGGQERNTIPKVLHVIWLGPKEFPSESVARIKGWIARHPGWEVKFWTDQERAVPCEKMQKILFNEFPFAQWADLYYASDNFGEKSEILRYAVLESEGGIYIDHDMTCLGSFEMLRSRYDFFCGLEELKPTVLSSSIYPATNLIAARPHHPVCLLALTWLQQNWEKLERFYPGNDPQAVMYRVKRRSFSALDAGVDSGIDLNGNRDIIFPAQSFNQTSPAGGSLAFHAHAGSWYKKELESEKQWRGRLGGMAHKNKWALIFAVLGTTLNIAILVLLLKRFRSLRRL